MESYCCSDTIGIRAEDLKGCDEETKELMRDFFNMVNNHDSIPSNSWNKVVIKVIYETSRSIDT